MSPSASAYWVHDWSPFVLRFGDSFGVRWYGVAYLMGFVVGGLLLWLYAKKGSYQLAA